MVKLFGRKMCSTCQKKKAELDAAGIKYQYYDLDTTDGLAEAAYYGLGDKPLPIVKDEEE